MQPHRCRAFPHRSYRNRERLVARRTQAAAVGPTVLTASRRARFNDGKVTAPVRKGNWGRQFGSSRHGGRAHAVSLKVVGRSHWKPERTMRNLAFCYPAFRLAVERFAFAALF